MACSNKKRGKIEISTLVSLIIVAIAIVAIFSFLIQTRGILSEDILTNYGCYLGNAIRSGGGLFAAFSGGCILEEVEDINQEELATLLRITWWEYGKGQWDFGSIIDEVYPTYVFTVDETIDLQNFVDYLATHKNGKESSLSDSDYSYLQKGSLGQTLCFHTKAFENKFFEPEKSYYLLFRDSQGGLGSAGKYDDIVISDKLTFKIEGVGGINCLLIDEPVIS